MKKDAFYDRAMDRIRDEMASNSSHAIQYIGEQLTQYLMRYPEIAEDLANEKRTLAGGLEEIRKAAMKAPRVGNMAMIDPEQGMQIVLAYYGVMMEMTPTDLPLRPAAKQEQKQDGGALDLDALLGWG